MTIPCSTEVPAGGAGLNTSRMTPMFHVMIVTNLSSTKMRGSRLSEPAVFYGAISQDRTGDLLLTMQSLYQLS